MKTKFISESLKQEIVYDGSQLRPLFAYLEHGLLGDSVISWIGGCDISLQHMMDGEDILDKAKIAGSKMLHFIFEIYDTQLRGAVAFQRLFASIAKDLLEQMQTTGQDTILRKGDDLYWRQGKLSISIAAPSVNSNLIHFAINISNEGTPVKTASLEDLGIAPVEFADRFMQACALEWKDCLEASYKVRASL